MSPSKDEPASDAASDQPCLATLTLERDESYLEEVRGRLGAHLHDYQQRFEAKNIDPSEDQPLRAGAELTVGGATSFWFAPSVKAVVVDARLFTALEVVDLPRLTSGEQRRVGRSLATGPDAPPPRQLVEALLRGGVLQAFWHIGAELCLRSESTKEAGYEAAFDAVHTYFTNRGNRDPYRFVVRISRDGEIFVAAL